MKNLKLILIFTSLFHSVFYNLTLAQEIINNEKLSDLEGTWVYKDKNIDFTVILLPVKIKIMGNDSDQIIGYVKLKINEEVIFDRLHVAENLSPNNTYEFQQIFDPYNSDRLPNINLSLKANQISGVYFINKKTGEENFQIGKGLNLFVDFNNGDLIWNFSNFINKRERVLDHIPAVPSTWLLKRVEY